MGKVVCQFMHMKVNSVQLWYLQDGNLIQTCAPFLIYEPIFALIIRVTILGNDIWSTLDAAKWINKARIVIYYMVASVGDLYHKS